MKTIRLFLSVFLSASLFGQQMTYVPDDYFEAFLETSNGSSGSNLLPGDPSSLGDGIMNDSVPTEKVMNATILQMPYEDYISDLTGIQDFSNLQILNVADNQLTSIDLSQNILLENIVLNNNQLTSIDLSQNMALKYLYLVDNYMTSIDISNNPSLLTLALGNANSLNNMQLTSLDVTNNTQLEMLYCNGNLISSLDLSQNAQLSYLYCPSNLITCLDIRGTNLAQYSFENPSETNFYANMNPLLTCIEVSPSDLNYVLNNFTQIDSQTSFSLDCNNDCSSSSSLTELTNSKNLIQILDLMGRETSFKPNTPLIYVYDDGSIEKVFTIE